MTPPTRRKRREPVVSLVAAVAANGVIGRDGDMPWRLATDLKRFRRLTWGKPVVMGRRTFEAIGMPLSGRHSIVMSRHRRHMRGTSYAETLDDALAQARDWAWRHGVDEVCVIGGGEIYRAALPRADMMRITHVDAAPEGDTTFPDFAHGPGMPWKAIAAADVAESWRDSYSTRYRVYRRVAV